MSFIKEKFLERMMICEMEVSQVIQVIHDVRS